jgi:hypothetical protein
VVEIEELRKMLKDHEKRISKLESLVKPTDDSVTTPVKKSKVSITDLLIELKSEGFFKEPRFVSQIVEKLAEMTYHYPDKSLHSPLQRAVKARILGRIRKDEQWAYVAR